MNRKIKLIISICVLLVTIAFIFVINNKKLDRVNDAGYSTDNKKTDSASSYSSDDNKGETTAKKVNITNERRC